MVVVTRRGINHVAADLREGERHHRPAELLVRDWLDARHRMGIAA